MVNLSYRQLLPRVLSRRSGSDQKGSANNEGKLRNVPPKKAPPKHASLLLPVELLIKIFELLPVVNLLRCRSVCKRFKGIVDDSMETQYMIELHAAGYVDNSLCADLPAKARLSALRKEAHFWRSPKGTWKSTGFPWSVTEENMRNTNWDDNLWLRFKKGFGAEEDKWNSLECVLFQPVEGGPPVIERWELVFPFSFVCATACAPQSMVVLLNVEMDNTSLKENYVIWKVSVRDGTVLSRDVLPFDCAPSPDWAEPEISVKNNGASITRTTRPEITEAQAHITILDLDTCSNAYTTTRKVHHQCIIASQYVDDKTVLLHLMEESHHTVEVYSVVTVHPQLNPTLNSLAHFTESITKLWHAATLEFPSYSQVLLSPIRENGFITGTSGGGLMPSISAPERPFRRSVADPLIFLIRYYPKRLFEVTRVTHVYPLSFIQSLVRDFRDVIARQDLEWESWGPRHSRCFVDSSSVITGAYGSQILLADWRMLEFNPRVISHEMVRIGKGPLHKARKRLAFRRSSKEDVELPEGRRVVRQPNVFPIGHPFNQKVVTSLPYIETRLKGMPARPVLVFGGEVWIACTAEVDNNGSTAHNCYTLSP